MGQAARNKSDRLNAFNVSVLRLGPADVSDREAKSCRCGECISLQGC